MKSGIDAISFYIPNYYLPIDTLAEARQIEPAKLKSGLGLHKMAIPLAGEDAATMAAEALKNLFEDENLNPSEISRIYLGTESALDNAKPTISYAVEMLENWGLEKWGPRAFKNCDVVDLTFACIGATDALQNSIDYVSLHPNEKVIVVASDLAKYDLNSTGEYTQGAGAVALLITQNPRILSFKTQWGVGMQSVHDFFKPKRSISKSQLAKVFQSTLQEENPPLLGIDETYIEFTKESPVFDGQFSNQCFSDRMKEAYAHFCEKNQKNELCFEEWYGLIFHLPYAYHGKRIFVDLWADALARNGKKELLESAAQSTMPQPNSPDFKDFVKKLAKSDVYAQIHTQKLENASLASSQIGNMYTASVFMALLSFLSMEAEKNTHAEGKEIGFIAYGSGSKSKVFSAQIEMEWKKQIQKCQLWSRLNERMALSMEQYLAIHKKENNAMHKSEGFVLDHIETQKTDYLGARTYAWNKIPVMAS